MSFIYSANPLYSLEKLIEWKQLLKSLLVFLLLNSLLAREINWMETSNKASKSGLPNFSLYSLEKLIEWKPSEYIVAPGKIVFNSLLAREINWMETWLLADYPKTI